MIYLPNMVTFYGHVRLPEGTFCSFSLGSRRHFAAFCRQDNGPVAAAFHAWRCCPEPSLSADWHGAKASNPKSTCARGASCAAGCAVTCFTTFIQAFFPTFNWGVRRMVRRQTVVVFESVCTNHYESTDQPEFITAIQG